MNIDKKSSIQKPNAIRVATMLMLGMLAISTIAAAEVAEPTVSKIANPTDIGLNEETTITLTIQGAGSEWTTPVPIDVMLVIDRSGSMGGTKIADAKSAAKTFVDKTSASDRVGLASFATTAQLDIGLTTNHAAVKSKIDLLSASGSTAMGDGIHTANVEINTNGDSNHERAMILLSDGLQNAGTWTPTNAANEAKNLGIKIYTIGLGTDASTTTLTNIATTTGGKYYFAPTSDKLEEIYNNIYKEIVTNTIPHYVDVVEVTQSYIIDEGSFSVPPASVNTDSGTGQTTIIWNNIGLLSGDGSSNLSSDETVTLSFKAKSSISGKNLDVDVYGDAKVNYNDSSGGYVGSVLIPQATINVNTPPVAEAGGPYSVDEGSSVTLSGSGSTDPDGDILTYAWDLNNDAIYETISMNAIITPSDGPATQTVGLQVSDGKGGISTDTATVTVNNVAPVVDAGTDATINEGDTFSSSGSFTDPGTDTWTATVDYGDGSGVQPLTLTGKTFTLSHMYADNCACTVTVTVTDKDGGVGTDTATVTVNNVVPVVNAGPDATINEGSTFSSSGSFTDPGTDTWTATVDYGDGSGVQPLTLTGKTFTLSHTYADNCACTVTVTVTDDDGGAGTGTATVTVNNVAPTVGPISAPVDLATVGTAITATAGFTDPGTADTHTAVWNWGDGTSVGTVTETSGSGSVTDLHTYATPGIYTVTLTVTDDDGGVGSSEYRYVVVYDPDGGFVTGGGWINSPAGAYAADASLAGKATFGFVSKYHKGASVPSGQTEFQFKVADLNFHSTAYEWLVIAGTKAQYKGTGTINGEGNYQFMLTAIDGNANGGDGIDRFRIKITGPSGIVYDNKMGSPDDGSDTTELGGGSIVIHKSS